jgi:alkanesulfonate monooxygenase SsuD/methylene tetrahydromethanopterin reductase-like flavin-dependent oxidoreductase (luciferase family)
VTQVEFGIYIPAVSLGFSDLLQRATLCEELGVTSFWLYDHLYAPGLPEYDAFEEWTLATALLARTSRLRVGHLVLNNNFRHPVLLAKMATTLDVISEGRLDFGIGSGSYQPEHDEAGFPWGTLRERSERLAEGLEIITRMFTEEWTTFEGTHYRVQNVPNLPRPFQVPRPPIHVGGIGEKYTIPLVARYADVWNIPTNGLDRWERAARALSAQCEELGRDPTSIRKSLQAVLVLVHDESQVADARSTAKRRYPDPGFGVDAAGFIGTPATVVDRIGEYVEKGVTLFIFIPYDRGKEVTLRLFAEQVMPHFR